VDADVWDRPWLPPERALEQIAMGAAYDGLEHGRLAERDGFYSAWMDAAPERKLTYGPDGSLVGLEEEWWRFARYAVVKLRG
jgi:hypothetical protein